MGLSQKGKTVAGPFSVCKEDEKDAQARLFKMKYAQKRSENKAPGNMKIDIYGRKQTLVLQMTEKMKTKHKAWRPSKR